MTREEKISELINIRDNFNYTLAPREVFDDAIKALEQEPCEDAVSRQSVLNLVNSDWKYEGLEEDVASLPPVTPQLKTGHWGRKTKVDAYDIAGVKTWGIKCQCDRCGFTTIVVEDFGYYTYCPNCGAKMKVRIRNDRK